MTTWVQMYTQECIDWGKEQEKKAGKPFRWQCRYNVCGRWQARKEGWVRRFSDHSTVLRKVQPGQSSPWTKATGWSSPTSPQQGLSPLQVHLPCHLCQVPSMGSTFSVHPEGLQPGSPVTYTHHSSRCHTFSWLLKVTITHSPEKRFSETALVS